MPGRVEAATVDHGLRAEAAREAADVEEVCAWLGVPHATLLVTPAGGNMQAQARTARYAALHGWLESRGLHALATAHHADDQAETLLLRLNRGSGVAGLAGVRSRGQVPGGALPLLRPLLSWRRAELCAIVAETGLSAAQDPTNADERFDRARLRKALAMADWLDIAAIAGSAGHLADADAALDWAAEREWREAVTQGDDETVYRPTAPRAVALRVIARIVTDLGGAMPRGSAVARLYEALSTGTAATLAGAAARPTRAGWAFRRERGRN